MLISILVNTKIVMHGDELLGLDLDDDLTDAPDGTVSSLYQIGHAVLSIRQHPGAGRQHAAGYEHLCPEESASTTLPTAPDTGGYRSNTPNVGWLVWSSTFVLARHLMRTSWDGVHVLELVRWLCAISHQGTHRRVHQGAGVGVLGLAMAKHGARVTLTDLPHVTPWTRLNAERNFAADDPLRPRVCDYMWGCADQAVDVLAGAENGFAVVLAADCVYEEQYYPELLAALQQTVAADGHAYVCYKRRRLRQEMFAKAARGGGWGVEDVPLDDEEYCLLVLTPAKSIH